MTGMRDDVDLAASVLTIQLTRLGKSRLVQLQPTTRTAVRAYAHRCDGCSDPAAAGPSSLPNR